MLLRSRCDNMARQHAWTKENHLHRIIDYGRWRSSSSIFIQPWPIDCCKTYNWIWKWLVSVSSLERLLTNTGMNTSTVPTWQSETSKSHRRGQMVMIEGSIIVFGVMISYWIDLGFSFLEPSSVSWRFPIAFQIVLALIILAGIPNLPESPRWLVLKERDEDAILVLSALSDLPP